MVHNKRGYCYETARVEGHKNPTSRCLGRCLPGSKRECVDCSFYCDYRVRHRKKSWFERLLNF
jgi:hypothetical protein